MEKIFIGIMALLISISAVFGYAVTKAEAGETVWTWGYNAGGKLEDGTTTNRYTPVQVNGLTDVTAIAGGEGHTIFKTTHAGS